MFLSFKPYYNWNTFNTNSEEELYFSEEFDGFKPYYNWNTFNTPDVIAGTSCSRGFKPYYNWNTFNTYRKRNYRN